MDIDDELQLLQRELMAVQEEKTNPLSERTVAEIMVKLYHEGFAFIPTTDGNEYVTPEKLDGEIATLVRQRGRIGLNILPQLLNVGQDVVENRLNALMQKWPVTRHGGNLFSQKYFDNLILSLAQKLEEEGKVDIEHLAVQNELKTDFAERLVKQNLHKLNAELSGKHLITKQYTLLQKSKILGFLSAINNPLQIDILYKTVQSSAKAAQQIILELINQNLIKGKLSNGYYVPDRFTANQKKIVGQFLDNNGFVDSEMLQKKYLISKPDQWIKKNLEAKFVKIERFYIKQQKLETYATQIHSLLKSQGFIELSHVLPLDFDEKSLHWFLENQCGLKDYFSFEGYVYSNEWLERLAGEFKHKIIHNIFFRKGEGKGKDAKKKGKKDKVEPLVTEQELQQVLFNGGYAEYSIAQTLASELLQILIQKLEELKKKIQKELTHSKGLISSSFLKYKFCKSILRTEESLSRAINIIQKQLKKAEKWVDADFGPNETDLSGMYGVHYYDNVLPKGWPSMQALKWKQVKSSQLLSAEKQPEGKSYPMKKCMFVPLCQLIAFYNGLKRFKIQLPQMQPLTQCIYVSTSESSVPFIYRFYISEKEVRYVIVDNLLPFVDGAPLSSLGPFSLAEKAYAKLRYCYKGIINVGVHQILLEVTGKDSIRYNGDTEKERESLYGKIEGHLANEDFIVILAEGQSDKKLIIDQNQSELQTLKPYVITGRPQEVVFYPTSTVLPLKTVLELFRNIFVIVGNPNQ